MIISGRTSLLALIDRELARQRISQSELCRRSDVGVNTLCNLRSRHSKNMSTTLALVNALGFDLLAVPTAPGQS